MALCLNFLSADISFNESYTGTEFTKQLQAKNGIVVRPGRRYDLEISPEWINWVRRRFDYGYPIALYNGIMKKDNASCMIIFGPAPEWSGNRTPIRTELFDVLGKDYEFPKRAEGDTTVYLVSPRIPDSFKVSDFTSSLSGRKANVDEIVYFRVPRSSSASFLSFDDNSPSFVQSIHESGYPIIYRVFFFKDGKQVFDLILLLSEKADKHPEKYMNELGKLFLYQP